MITCLPMCVCRLITIGPFKFTVARWALWMVTMPSSSASSDFFKPEKFHVQHRDVRLVIRHGNERIHDHERQRGVVLHLQPRERLLVRD